MIRRALLLCAGIIAAACFACVQQRPAPAPPTICNPQPFLNNAYMLPAGFQPDPNKNQMLPSSSTPVADPYKTDLMNAYCLASPSFQQQLLGLTAVYIDQTQCSSPTACVASSWGLRERNYSNQTYVALSYGLWSGGLPTYSAFEYLIVSNLLGIASSPITIQANPDTPTMTVLAALAHELGHVKWWQDQVEGKKCSTPPTGSQPLFANNSWLFHDDMTPRFQYFGQERHYNPYGRSRQGNLPKGLVDKDILKNDINTRNTSLENQDLSTIYDGEWASIFATVTPDEDFVETYVLAALIPPMQQTSGAYLKIVIPGQAQPADVMNYFTNPSANTNLYNKGQWVQQCII
jgi:hypothetical protein